MNLSANIHSLNFSDQSALEICQACSYHIMSMYVLDVCAFGSVADILNKAEKLATSHSGSSSMSPTERSP